MEGIIALHSFILSLACLVKAGLGAGDSLLDEIDGKAYSNLLSSVSHNNPFLAVKHCVLV